MKQKIYNTIYGAIIGDALGVPVEFRSREELTTNPVKGMIGYGTFNLPKGCWSDDSSMILCIADSIARKRDIVYDDIMKCFWNWYNHSKYTPTHRTFDVGSTCYRALCNYKRKIPSLECGIKSEDSNGNGSLMRFSPMPLYLFQKYGPDAMDNEDSFQLIHNVSKLTHAHEISLIGCDLYTSFMIEILNGRKKEDLQFHAFIKVANFVQNLSEYQYAFNKYNRLFDLNFKELPENEIRSTGFVVDTLEAAVWCFLTTNNYSDCVLKAVNLGHDTDTIACVAGSIAGLYYGEIPEEWIKTIKKKKLIDRIINDFSESILE